MLFNRYLKQIGSKTLLSKITRCRHFERKKSKVEKAELRWRRLPPKSVPKKADAFEKYFFSPLGLKNRQEFLISNYFLPLDSLRLSKSATNMIGKFSAETDFLEKHPRLAFGLRGDMSIEKGGRSSDATAARGPCMH